MLFSLITACGSDGDAEEPATASPEVTATATEAPTSPATPSTDEEADDSAAVIETAMDGTIRVAASAGNYLYVVISMDMRDVARLHIFEIAGDGSMQEVGSLSSGVVVMRASLGALSQAAVTGDTLLVPLPTEDGSGGLWVVDVSDPAAPTEIALIETELPPLSVVVSGDVAVVATMSFSNSLHFYDIADPADIQQVGEPTQSFVQIPPNMAIVDSILYVADESGVDIIDVSSLDAPEVVGTFENPDWSGPGVMDPSATDQGEVIVETREMFEDLGFSDIAVAGESLYIVADDGGVEIVDVSDPTNPVEAGQVELDGHSISMAASDGQLYVLAGKRDGEDGPVSFMVNVVEVSDSSEPKVLETIEISGQLSQPGPLLIADDVLIMFGFGIVHVIPLS